MISPYSSSKYNLFLINIMNSPLSYLDIDIFDKSL